MCLHPHTPSCFASPWVFTLSWLLVRDRLCCSWSSFHLCESIPAICRTSCSFIICFLLAIHLGLYYRGLHNPRIWFSMWTGYQWKWVMKLCFQYGSCSGGICSPIFCTCVWYLSLIVSHIFQPQQSKSFLAPAVLNNASGTWKMNDSRGFP